MQPLTVEVEENMRKCKSIFTETTNWIKPLDKYDKSIDDHSLSLLFHVDQK